MTIELRPSRVRSVRVPDELWTAAKDRAWQDRISVGVVIREALAEYVARPRVEETR